MRVTAKNGFTLLEMLVATAIFAIVTVASYNGLSILISHQERIAPHKKNIAQLSYFSKQLTNDMIQYIDRPITDHLGSTKAGLLVSDAAQNDRIIELTRKNIYFFGALHDNPLQRISYELKDSTLYRGVWLYLDRSAFDVQPILTKVLEGVNTIEITLTKEKRTFKDNYSSLDFGRPSQMRVVVTLESISDFTIFIPL